MCKSHMELHFRDERGVEALKTCACGEEFHSPDRAFFEGPFEWAMMYRFKVLPCPKPHDPPHDWELCPYWHLGETARRRDPLTCSYSCRGCPHVRKNRCRSGDLCRFSHNIFESRLHPVRYRTEMCRDGWACKKKVCFFAHNEEELRKTEGASDVGSPMDSDGTCRAAGGLSSLEAGRVFPEDTFREWLEGEIVQVLLEISSVQPCDAVNSFSLFSKSWF